MELREAREVLGVRATDEWTVVRSRYRELIGNTHPDRAGDSGLDSAVLVNDAYRSLRLADRDGRLHDTAVVPPTRTPPTAPQTRRPRPQPRTASDVVVDGDTMFFGTAPTETFMRLVEAGHLVGDISYVDRSSAILEVMVRLRDGTPASLVFSLQWRAHDAICEAYATLEAIDRAESLDVSGVLEQMVPFLPPADQ